MESFSTFLFQIYKDFDQYIDEEYGQQSQQQQSKTSTSSPLIDSLSSSNSTPTTSTQTSTSSTSSTYNVDFLKVGRDLIKHIAAAEQANEHEEVNQYLEFIMCMCFFSGNQSVWRPLIVENIQLFANKIITKDYVDGIPFCYAIPFGSRELLELLVSHGMDLAMELDNGYVMTSALYGNVEAYDFFHARNARLNHRNNNGDTALLFAAMNGENVLLEKLARGGEDLRAVNNHGFNVFICAAFHNQADTIVFLAKLVERMHGKKQLLTMINAKDKEGETPMHIGARLGFTKTVRALLTHGAEMNLGNKAKQTPLDLARRALTSIKKDPNYLTPSSAATATPKSLIQHEMFEPLPHIRRLLPDDFKNRLVSKLNLVRKVKRSIKSYQKVINLFDERIKQREIEITKNLEELLLQEQQQNSKKKGGGGKKANNKQQSKRDKANNIGRPSTQSTAATVAVRVDKIQQQAADQLAQASVEKELCILEEQDQDTPIDTSSSPTPSESTTSPQLQSNSINQSPDEHKPTHHQSHHHHHHHQHTQQQHDDYRDKYRDLAIMYLEQSARLKETLEQLTEIENHFIEYKEQLYAKNEKAEALGLGVSEILGTGLNYLNKLKLYERINDPI
ncbi:hypothetical protein SAMD00019534_039190 [Acytostelium subglobosum LB1]|uniref:hypothetical protein n=1 Tax=Acytostelium subglobosum LB1 TaxID=1410327 RepID=UPI00064521D6|nr:hypothetical protein SAMD00019534_039190 [Acytostelium subglobosum LB1]GAM20744.1 hypothetical protein SAMD00019534_039190 [Acytostelium subglobosum LB1]|eukprot:XP_012755878.1 hypothetical protein SAMD00019534_039190 [Acytostelium subglobosum LB1]